MSRNYTIKGCIECAQDAVLSPNAPMIRSQLLAKNEPGPFEQSIARGDNSSLPHLSKNNGLEIG